MLLLTESVRTTGEAENTDEEGSSKTMHRNRVATQEWVIREDACTFQERLKFLSICSKSGENFFSGKVYGKTNFS